jgi:Skp family chaperone for outer membrane proteins
MPISAVNAYLTEFVAHLTQQNTANLHAAQKSQYENKQLVLLLKRQQEEMEAHAQMMQQGISEVARAAGFSEAFSNPADSYLSRLSEHVKAVNDATVKLKKIFGVIREEKTKLESDLASMTAERDAFQARLQKLGAVTAQLKAKLDADDDRYRREQSEVLSRLRLLLPGLGASIPPDAPFRVQVDKFLADFPRALAAEATRRFPGPMSAVHSAMETLITRLVGFQERLSGLLQCHQRLRQEHENVVQASRRTDDSYRDTLAVLFGARQPDLLDTRAIHDQVVKTQMILKSVFKLIPDFQLTPPDDLYLLALALRRQLGSSSIITNQEQLVTEIQGGEITAVDEHDSLRAGLAAQVRKAMLLLTKSVMLRSVIPPLAEILGAAAPQQTNEELTRLIEEARVRIRAGDILRQKVVEFHTRIKSLTDGLEVSLPESVSGVINTLQLE